MMSWTNRGRSEQKSDSRAMKSELSDKYVDESKKDCFDSGITDSGILSGSNLVSDSCLSGEISPPPEPSDDSARGKTDSYKRLDSGVDVELSDQLSGLDVQERLNDLSSERKGSTDGFRQNIPLVKVVSEKQLPWKYFFQQDEDGDSSLHIAVISNRYSDLVTLVRMIPEPKYLDIRNDMRQTALHLAVLTSQIKMVKLLVAAGASTDSVDHHGNTPLHLATAAGDLELVRELTHSPPEDRVQSLGLKYKCSPFSRHAVPPEINMYNYEGLSCVHLALMGNHITILKNLVWFGADINAGELKGGLTAVHMACMKGDIGLVKTLIEDLGADPCPMTYAGQSPYALARDYGLAANVTSCLLELGSSYLGDSDDEEEDHINAHFYSDSEDEDIQMVDRSMNEMRTFQLGVAV